MTGDDLLLAAEEKMEGAFAHFLERARGIRTGRATPEILDGVKVAYYGTPTPLKQVASIQVADATMLLLKPFDPSVVKEIERAILAANLGIMPQSDGKLLRLPIPPLSQDRRRKYADMLKTMAEEARVVLRNARRDANKGIDDGKKSGDFPEDDAKRLRDGIQRLTDEYGAKVEDLLKRKTEEIMKV